MRFRSIISWTIFKEEVRYNGFVNTLNKYVEVDGAMDKCKNCGRFVEKLIDEDLCERCHDIWLDNIIKETDILKIVELNRFKDELDEVR